MLAAAEALVNSEINLLFEFFLRPLIKVMDVKVVKELLDPWGNDSDLTGTPDSQRK